MSCVICKHVAATSSLKNLQIKSADKTVCMYTVQCRQRYPPKLRTHFSQVYFVVHFGIFLYFDPVFTVCNRTFVKLKPLHQNHFFHQKIYITGQRFMECEAMQRVPSPRMSSKNTWEKRTRCQKFNPNTRNKEILYRWTPIYEETLQE